MDAYRRVLASLSNALNASLFSSSNFFSRIRINKIQIYRICIYVNEVKGIINKGELGEIRRRDISENENLNTQLETRWPGSEVFLRVHCSLTLPNNPVPHGGTIHAYNKTACRLREEKRIGRGKSISATGSMSCDRFHVSFFLSFQPFEAARTAAIMQPNRQNNRSWPETKSRQWPILMGFRVNGAR